MSIFRALVFAAALAGLTAAAATTIIQRYTVIPLIAAAEAIESRSAPKPPGAAPDHGAHAHDHAGVSVGNAGASHNDHAAWAPRDGVERTGFTAAFNALQWIGFGLCLGGGLVLSRRTAGWREGLFWGLGGFCAFALAPAIGLPPDLPGATQAPLEARQIWWMATAAATAAGLALLAFRREPLAALAAVLLLAAPFIVGAPAPKEGSGDELAALTRAFAPAVVLTSLLGWTIVGAGVGALIGRFLPAKRFVEPAREISI